jgi:hypothetical protein
VDSMREVGGAAWTDQIELEWKRAFELISRMMIEGASAGEPDRKPGPGGAPVGLHR